MSERTATSVDDVVALFDAYAGDRYDEQVSQLDHALQTAALAAADAASDEVVVASLLHDVGHLLALRDGAAAVEDIDLHHEARGARWLAGLYGPSVTGPIALHVAAKRYLCAVEPGYQDGLSLGSQRSLARQGGPMDDDEIVRFRARPAHTDAVRLRRWDDSGKRIGIDVPPLASYRPRLESLVRP